MELCAGRGKGVSCVRGRFNLRAQTQRTLNTRSTDHQSSSTTSLDRTRSPSLIHASWPKQAEGSWLKDMWVSSMLCRMQEMKRHTAATLTWLSPCKIHDGPRARRRTTKREFNKQKRARKFNLQGPAPARCCSVAERQQ